MTATRCTGGPRCVEHGAGDAYDLGGPGLCDSCGSCRAAHCAGCWACADQGHLPGCPSEASADLADVLYDHAAEVNR